MPAEYRLCLQGPATDSGDTSSMLSEALDSERFDAAIVVSPFTTPGGVKLILNLLLQGKIQSTIWIVGLDGIITPPQVLVDLWDRPSISLYGYEQRKKGPYLHAKLYIFYRGKPAKLVAYIGSANTTTFGLEANIEAGTILSWGGPEAASEYAHLRSWVKELLSSVQCSEIDERAITRYKDTFVGGANPARLLKRIIGAKKPSPGSGVRANDYAWIELAVRGGSSNQIEICQRLAGFFTGGASGSRADFDVVDKPSGTLYSGNAYRFRSGNTGYRVEVNTDLARKLRLADAAKRRDIILFRRLTPKRIEVAVHSAGSREAKKLKRIARAENRLFETYKGPGGRKYRV